jgi:Ca2+-binding RTX toxin-like protein
MINKGAAYSAVATNTSKDLTVLKAAIAAGSTNNGTTDVNVGSFTATNDTVNVTARTLGAGDSYEDKSAIDTDVLNLDMSGNLVNPLNGVRIINIETININAQGLVGAERLSADATGVVNTAGVITLDNNPVTTNTFIGTHMDFTTQTNISGTKTITVSGDSKGANLELQNVRDEVTLVDASKFSDDNSEAEGILLNFSADINKGTHTTAHTILGSTGADVITSGDGADSIKGDRGNDSINGGGGNDTITGDAGDDIIWGADGNDVTTGGAGNDRLYTNGDTVAKTGDADTIDAGDGNDYVQASPGDTNTGVASILGGTGSDFIDLDGVTGGLTVDGQDDNDTVLVRNNAAQAFTADFTKLEGGFGGADALTVMSNVSADAIVRTVNKATGFEIVRITNLFDLSDSTTANVGTAFNDGTSSDNDGTNNLANSDARDTDTDETVVTTSATLALGGLTVAVTVDLSTETTSVNLTTGSGADTITMGSGNDVVNGGAGADSIAAGAGDDAVAGAQDDVLLDGGAHAVRDILQIGATFEDVSDAQIVNFERVVLTQNNIRVSLDGQTEAFDIVGANGLETILGGSANDTISAGVGDDTLTGNAGADTFILDAAISGTDVITDFTVGDILSVNVATPAANTFFAGGIAGVAVTDEIVVLNAATFANLGAAYAAGTFAATTEVLVFFVDTATNTTRVVYDSNGETAGGETVLATLTGITTIGGLAAITAASVSFT